MDLRSLARSGEPSKSAMSFAFGSPQIGDAVSLGERSEESYTMPLPSIPCFKRTRRRRKPTVLLRSILLITALLTICALLWATALALFLPKQKTRFILPLALIAWTLGLRHGLDSDHIIAIDSVTRNLVTQGQLSILVGLFFSLGHSTIVVAVTIAVIVSVANAGRLDGVAGVGGIVGVCVSASFLLVLAIINSIMLIGVLRKRQKLRAHRQLDATQAAPSQMDFEEKHQKVTQGSTTEEGSPTPMPAFSCVARIVRPALKLIDRPWKMYPIGILFGFGFDTSSEIALLGVSALSARGSVIPPSQIILLPLLFTSGMSLVDSLDSVLMLFAYSVPEGKLEGEIDGTEVKWWRKLKFLEGPDEENGGEKAKRVKLKQINEESLMSVSIVLTTLSILIAFFISLVEFMGLAAEKCGKCAEQAENDSGLAGRWWRFWIAVNDESGYLGAGVVGIFIVVFGSWGISRWISRRKAQRAQAGTGTASHIIIVD